MAEDILAAVCIGIWFVIGYFGYKVTHRPEPEVSIFDSTDLQREINSLNEMVNRVAELDNMIIDLGLCKPSEVLRAFRMEWQGSAGINHSFDFMADGQSDSSAHLLELAIAERAELNTQVAQRIADIYAKACALSFQEEIDRGSGREGEIY